MPPGQGSRVTFTAWSARASTSPSYCPIRTHPPTPSATPVSSVTTRRRTDLRRARTRGLVTQGRGRCLSWRAQIPPILTDAAGTGLATHLHCLVRPGLDEPFVFLDPHEAIGC